jgi:pimeloyl-ACP methyl ester carboxylesterase
MTALVVQNTPAYPEGSKGGFWGPIAAYWKSGSVEDRNNIRPYLGQQSIKRQYTLGVRDPSLIDPDNWVIDAALIARPGMDEVSLDLIYDIRNNVPVFAAARQYFRDQQPPTLIVSGANDEIFPGDNQKQYLNDLPDAELHLFDSGHCALEDKVNEIACVMHGFLDRKVPRP